LRKILLFVAVVVALSAQKPSSLSAALSQYIDIYDNLTYTLDGINYSSSDQRVAIVIPKKIAGKYILSTPKTILSYLLYSKKSFDMQVYTIENEDDYLIEDAYNMAEIDGYDVVVAILTSKSVPQTIEFAKESPMLFFIPTINKVGYEAGQNVIFGGIDYHAQVDALESLIGGEELERKYVFSSGGGVSAALMNYIEDQYGEVSEEFEINKESNYESLFDPEHELEDNKRREVESPFNNSACYINTPILSSSITLSQARYYETAPKFFLSTQINYHPLILTLTQYEDRANLYIANSITSYNEKLEDINQVFNNDIHYDWINYATSIGVDYLVNYSNTSLFSNAVVNNQIGYDVEIVQPSLYSFKKHQVTPENSEEF
jgi:hypothetical protein